MGTDGEMDISGVVGLSDCEHVEWEHGSMDYLRSLNTGNQRYRFLLTRPINDEHSKLWWKLTERKNLPKPPEPEEDPDVEDDPAYYGILYPGPEANDDEEQTPTWVDYKEYETERFLRWFGTEAIPHIDVSTITKKTICSIPVLSNDTESE